ncbi:hypothetical protein OIU78_010708 [Salix suchowensis]|uniref:Uncharacterized protein n=1 Tax=Salix koriyanagi TaxID=2511006 RepID=A0A9Q0Q6Q7_9ROSI|nr:hypothetical protein OIU78_010708 [Salix suchowensis]KAJ6700649.1 hypothetical protein OIU74_012073 [Salix koriyanagi]
MLITSCCLPWNMQWSHLVYFSRGDREKIDCVHQHCYSLEDNDLSLTLAFSRPPPQAQACNSME